MRVPDVNCKRVAAALDPDDMTDVRIGGAVGVSACGRPLWYPANSVTNKPMTSPPHFVDDAALFLVTREVLPAFVCVYSDVSERGFRRQVRVFRQMRIPQPVQLVHRACHRRLRCDRLVICHLLQPRELPSGWRDSQNALDPGQLAAERIIVQILRESPRWRLGGFPLSI